MSILSEIGTKLGTEIKSTNDRVAVLETSNPVNSGGKVLQVKNIQLNDTFLTSNAGFVTAISTQFDNPLSTGSKVLIRSTGLVTAGTADNNWGAVIFLACDDDMVNRGVDHGVYMSGGATDYDNYWGNMYAMEVLATPTNLNPVLKLVVNKDSKIDGSTGWGWIALGHSSTDYGHVTTSFTIMEIGV